MQPLALLLFRPQHTGLLIRAAQAVQQQQQQAFWRCGSGDGGAPAPAAAAPLSTFAFRGNRAARQQQQQQQQQKAGGEDGRRPPADATPSAAGAEARERAARELLARRSSGSGSGGASSSLPPPLLLPFAVTAREAAAAFEAEQSRRCLRLHASGVLDEALRAYEQGEGVATGAAAAAEDANDSATDADATDADADADASSAPRPPKQRLEPLLVPFWAFRAAVSARVTAATLGYREDPDDPNSPVVWRERVFDARAVEEDELLGAAGGGDAASSSSPSSSSSSLSPELERAALVADRRPIPWSAPAMQVCASLALRRDLAEGAKPLWAVEQEEGGNDGRPRPLSPDEAADLRVALGGGDNAQTPASSSTARILPPDLRQSVAWELALRALRHDLEAEAALRLARAAAASGDGASASGTDGPSNKPNPKTLPLVRDVRMRLEITDRHARLLLAPAWRAAYAHGEAHTPGRGNVVAQRFEALVSALRLERLGSFSSSSLERMFGREGGAALGLEAQQSGPYSAEAEKEQQQRGAKRDEPESSRRGLGTPPPFAAVSPYSFGLRHPLGDAAASSPHLLALPALSSSSPPRVVAELHPSAAKARTAAAAAAGGAALAAAAAGQALGLWGVDEAFGAAAAWGLVDAAFVAFLAAAAANTAAGRLPQLARNRYASAQRDAERLFHRAYDRRQTELMMKRAAGAGVAGAQQEAQKEERNSGAASSSSAAAAAAALHAGAPDTHMLWLWADEDWRKWEEEAPWDWDAAERGSWADECLREGARRERERAAALKRARDAAAALAKARRMGQSTGAFFDGDPHWQGAEYEYYEDEGLGGGEHHSHRRHHAGHFSHGGGGGGGGGSAPRGARRLRGGGRGDFLGYYRLLGLDPAAVRGDQGSEGSSSSATAAGALIRAAYARAALKLHPDTAEKAEEDDAEERRRAAERFRKLQVAYETLRDPERRAAYDRGQLLSAGGG